VLTLLFSSSLSYANTCEKISASVSKCTVTYAAYNTEVSNCTGHIVAASGIYQFFTVKNANLEKVWLEDSNGIVPQSLEKQVRYDGKKIMELERYCASTREEQTAKIVSKDQLDNAIKQFMKTP
jgi:hypothetical protein